MSYRYDTFCGLYCGACFVMRANEEGRVEAQAKEWDREAEEITCHGCKSDVLSGYCRTCEIKACAMQRGVAACADCQDYPCNRLIAFRNDEWPHHSAVTQNSEELARIGLEQWLKAQAERWSCAACGGRTSWYDETCPGCGAAVRSSRAEDSEIRENERQEGS